MKERVMTCILCPKGCQLRGQKHDGTWIISGNSCPKGLIYAKQELQEPRRILTSTVKTTKKNHPRLSVKLSKPIPLKDFKQCLEIIKHLRVQGSISPGQVLMEQIWKRDSESVNLIATDSL